MEQDQIRQALARAGEAGEPHIELIKSAPASGARLGVFASSFNPVTLAHAELMRRAIEQFSLDEVIALAGLANADKTDYECPLEDRLGMLTAAFKDDARVSVGVSSSAYFVDMAYALNRLYPARRDLHFVVGFDTFERVMDFGNRYADKYHHKFGDRTGALRYLLAHSRLIVAGRAGAGFQEVRRLIEREPEEIASRIFYIDLPGELGERSATEVRLRLRQGLPITGLVPRAVEQYINDSRAYRSR